MSFRRVVVFAAALGAGVAMAQDAPPASTASAPAPAARSATAPSATPAPSPASPPPPASTPAPAASAPATPGSAKQVAAAMGPLSGDAQAGKAKAAVCGACHGIDGNSSMPQYPKLAGQNEHYIVEQRSEEHTSELQSRGHLVCRLLLEKKKKSKSRRNTLDDTA